MAMSFQVPTKLETDNRMDLILFGRVAISRFLYHNTYGSYCQYDFYSFLDVYILWIFDLFKLAILLLPTTLALRIVKTGGRPNTYL